MDGKTLHYLRELLAVVHRDGGHYDAEHGTEKATRDAIALIIAERVRAERYRKALVEIERDAETFKEAVLIAHKVLKDNRD